MNALACVESEEAPDEPPEVDVRVPTLPELDVVLRHSPGTAVETSLPVLADGRERRVDLGAQVFSSNSDVDA